MLNELFRRAMETTGGASLNTRRRLADHAASLDSAGTLQARLDVCIARTAELIKVLYEPDATGRLFRVDDVTGEIKIPVPWGNSGWRYWGLRKWEGACYNQVLRKMQRGRTPTLFAYNPESRCWVVDLELFPTIEHALLWLKDHGPSLKVWRDVVETRQEHEYVRRRKMYPKR